MNPLVSVTESQAGQDVELRFLEDLLNDDCKCQSTHHEVPACSVEVVARKTTGCDNRDFLICQSSYVWNMRSINSEWYTCAGCGRLTADCWEIRPI